MISVSITTVAQKITPKLGGLTQEQLFDRFSVSRSWGLEALGCVFPTRGVSCRYSHTGWMGKSRKVGRLGAEVSRPFCVVPPPGPRLVSS